MKSLLLFGVFLVLVVFAAGGLLAFRSYEAADAVFQGEVSQPVQAASPAGELSERQVQDLRTQIAHLNTLVADLQTQVSHLQSSASREAVPVETEAVNSESLAAAGLTPPQIEARMIDVIAAEKAREEEERAAKRAERERENALRQAERVASDLGMSAADTNVLAEHLYTTGAKRNEMFTQMREGGFDRTTMRGAMDEMREWNTQELDRLFGPTLAPQIAEQTGGDWGRAGGRGGNTGGGRRGGGQGGGN